MNGSEATPHATATATPNTPERCRNIARPIFSLSHIPIFFYKKTRCLSLFSGIRQPGDHRRNFTNRPIVLRPYLSISLPFIYSFLIYLLNFSIFFLPSMVNACWIELIWVRIPKDAEVSTEILRNNSS